MKLFKKILFAILLVILIGIAGIYIYLLSTKPTYSGKLILKGLKKSVSVHYDNYGIPHFYASNEEDAYYALGYAHAQDRLFQMEILRRVGSGRLSEILGKDLTKVDAFFRTLGIGEAAKKSAALYMNNNKEPYQRSALAYIAGVNQFLENGKTPVEFILLKIPKEKFTPVDLYFITGYMSFSFAEALRNEPVLTRILKQYGKEYLKNISPYNEITSINLPAQIKDSLKASKKLSYTIDEILNKIPVAPFIGSNAWAIAPSKTKSGKVLLANDTHIGYGQPSVWYEAHLEYPGFSFYGNFLAGFPFALVGHSKNIAWGVTMLENDDMDLFREKQNPENTNQYWSTDHWENYETRHETIKTKEGTDSTFQILFTRHGPVINSVIDNVGKNESDPISLWWTFTKFNGTTLQATYNLNHSQNIGDVRKACAMIEAPGLNIIYGDGVGNIAWWACAKMVKRLPHVNSKIILDGASGNDEPQGYYDFSQNPHQENPACGFVYSANNLPDSISKDLFPGYFAPVDRSKRILKYLNTNQKFTAEDMHKINSDVVSDVHAGIAHEIISTLQDEDAMKKSSLHKKAAEVLQTWNGNHQLNDIAPTVYYKLLSYVLELGMKDEIGKDDFSSFEVSHTMKIAYNDFIKNDSSLWWDNVETKNIKETRKEIFSKALIKTIDDLQKQFGTDISQWTWNKVHSVEFIHLIGNQKPLDKLFNVGPLPAPGGSETINNASFPLNTDGLYKMSFGPAMRIVIDFADVENAESILPTGQSGNFMSKHYADQSEMYLKCESRKMMMDKEGIEKTSKNKLVLMPIY